VDPAEHNGVIEPCALQLIGGLLQIYLEEHGRTALQPERGPTYDAKALVFLCARHGKPGK